jgi:glutaredoxin
MQIPRLFRPALLLSALASALLLAPPAWAQYKVVGPDGSVTYTDRPPAASNLRITPIGRTAGAAAAAAAAAAAGGDGSLPLELRTPTQRHPVTLYTSDGCQACDGARRLLQARGVPYTEKRVISEEDAAALERMFSARTVPSLTVGVQPLRGYNEIDWTAYLDAAGYPKQSRLPRGWQPPPVRPVVERSTPAAAPAAPPAPEPAAPDATEPPPAGVRF